MRDFQIKVAILLALFVSAFALFSIHALGGTIHEVQGGSNRLIPIHTALGFSTILEFESKPTSAVLGDQDGIKLEYVGNSITLKPLIGGSHTNLFVFTEFDRYNFAIQTGSSSLVDYIVRIKPTPDRKDQSSVSVTKSPEAFKTISVNRDKTSNGFILKALTLKLSRNQNDPRAASLIEFEIGSTKSKYDFSSASIGVKQNGKFLGVESLFLESTQVSPQTHPIRGVIAILNSEWNRKLPVSLVFAVLNPKTKKSPLRLEVSINPVVTAIKKGGEHGDLEKLFPTKAQSNLHDGK